MKKQAIIIMAHGSINLLNKLLELLDSKYFDIYLHIDIKSNIEEDSIYKCHTSNIYIYKKFDVRWGDYSMVETELFMFEEASKNNYEYYHLISGVDLPLKSNKEIFNIFHSNYPKEFIHFEDPKVLDYKINWIKYYHLMYDVRNNSTYADYYYKSIEKQKKDGVDRLKNETNTLRSGANWVSITHEFVIYLLSKKDYICDRFSFTKICDEFFFQTVVYNSEFVNNLYYDKFDSDYKACLRAIDWKRGNPYTWRIDDFNDLINSDKVFARKFDEIIDNEIIDKIYNYIKQLNNDYD